MAQLVTGEGGRYLDSVVVSRDAPAVFVKTVVADSWSTGMQFAMVSMAPGFLRGDNDVPGDEWRNGGNLGQNKRRVCDA